ncbi:UDP-glucose dehydrogenase family protein [Paenibacillus guangzhouensis]|uniref:UDP-glucose dehydrogenase family protein n=1 Tax=Paenibacillus guangzhouensis TaxID=1473112 RepID=UPI0012674153|nr:UDP-glucose/GDP-mannose dehydrogenase family protein [Paenibacillus guangzhouensis]
MNVVCIGSGYVGSITAASFAKWGHRTTIVDVDQRKIDLINAGKSPIYEPGLDTLIAQLVKDGLGKLTATTSYSSVSEANVVIIAVGTPSLKDGTADLKYVKSAAASIGTNLNPNRFTVIVNKSTVPVGTTDMVASIIEDASELKADENFAVVSNPEFLREGYALEDVFGPDRIVVGSNHKRARRVMRQMYSELLKHAPKVKYVETDVKSAELIKYASNAFLAVKISYINEMARLCESLGANVLEIAKGMGLDSRIGDKFLQVSSGWSGSCFPKDTKELLATSRKYGCDLSIVEASVTSNERMHRYCVEKIQRQLKTLNGKTIGILGLTFKPNTDDARETQAQYVIRTLLRMDSKVNAHDPKGMEMFQMMNEGLAVQYCLQAEEIAKRADALILLTHWEEYRALDWTRIFHAMRTPYILDTRNFLDGNTLRAIGFHYEGIGV